MEARGLSCLRRSLRTATPSVIFTSRSRYASARLYRAVASVSTWVIPPVGHGHLSQKRDFFFLESRTASLFQLAPPKCKRLRQQRAEKCLPLVHWVASSNKPTRDQVVCRSRTIGETTVSWIQWGKSFVSQAFAVLDKAQENPLLWPALRGSAAGFLLKLDSGAEDISRLSEVVSLLRECSAPKVAKIALALKRRGREQGVNVQ